LVFRRGDAPARPVDERGDDERAVCERELDGHCVARVVETERACLEDRRAAERVGGGGRRAAAEDDDGPPGFEQRVRGEGEADARRVGDLHAGEFDRRVRIVEKLYELIVVRAAHAVAVRVALDLDRVRIVGRHVGQNLVDDKRQTDLRCGVAGHLRAAIIGSDCRELDGADADRVDNARRIN
jgi:hypothetical protein